MDAGLERTHQNSAYCKFLEVKDPLETFNQVDFTELRLEISYNVLAQSMAQKPAVKLIMNHHYQF